MASISESLTYQQSSVVTLLRDHVQSQRDAIEVLERKAQHNFAIINIVTAFVAALNFDLGNADQLQRMFAERPLLIAILIGYAIVVFLSMRALVLRTQAAAPMEVSLNTARRWAVADLNNHYDILLQSYVNIYDHNQAIVLKKGQSVQWAHRFIAAVIVLVLVEASGLWMPISASLGIQ